MNAAAVPQKPTETTQILAEGEAGLWLSESLILALLQAGILDRETILEAIEVVIAAKNTMAEDGIHPDVSRTAAAYLATLSASIAAAKTGTPPASASSNRQKEEPKD